MTFDLRTESWLPLARRSGAVEWVPPSRLTDKIESDPFVRVASPRPDFDGAVTEFLVGLLSAALGPADEAAWRVAWDQPPAAVDLATALSRLPDAFDLEGDAAAFMQDLDAAALAERELLRVEQLLLDAPGEQALEHNKDLFVKRDRVTLLGRPAAAMALITLQTYAPSGGKGYRVSLRGGGPLTTLVDARREHTGPGSAAGCDSLWRLLWANVLPTTAFPTENTPNTGTGRFPWLAPTRTSEGKPPRETLPGHGDALQAFFGLPRRLRLVFGEQPAQCGLTGRQESRPVVGFRAAPYGAMYRNWRHPLTPYRRSEKDGALQPQHGQPGGVMWRDWMSLTIGEPDVTEPAAAVEYFRSRRWGLYGTRATDLLVFAYDFDNMKARQWVASRVPTFDVQDERAPIVREFARGAVDATGLAASLTKAAIDRVLFGEHDTPGDGIDAKPRVWAGLEGAFFDNVRTLAMPDGPDDWMEAAERFLKELRRCCLVVFDEHCPTDDPDPRIVLRAIRERRLLGIAASGYGKMGTKLRASFHLAPTDRAPARSGRRSPTRPKRDGRTT